MDKRASDLVEGDVITDDMDEQIPIAKVGRHGDRVLLWAVDGTELSFDADEMMYSIGHVMTTAEKIKAIEESGYRLAWDGCHKIYFLEDDERHQDAIETGYRIYPAAQIRALVMQSCGLVFVSRWGMGSNEDFRHDWNIAQCTADLYDIAAEA